MKSLESEEEAEENQDRRELEEAGGRGGRRRDGGGWKERETERGGVEWSRKRAEGVAASYGPYYGVK